MSIDRRATPDEIEAFVARHATTPVKRTVLDIDDGSEDVFVTLKLRTVNTTNKREHWAPRAARAKKEHEAIEAALAAHQLKRDRLAAGCTITLCRISPGTLDDDGLQAAMKAIRDSIARWLWGGRYGQMDSDPRGTWEYKQAKGGRGVHGVTVSITVQHVSPTISTVFESAVELIKVVHGEPAGLAPHSVCQDCGGKGGKCRTCAGEGWLPERSASKVVGKRQRV